MGVSETSVSFPNIVAGSTSGDSTFTLSSINLIDTIGGGSVTVTSPSSDFQVSNDGSTWGATASIAYTTRNLSGTVHVHFSPQTSGSKSGNVTFSGAAIGTSPIVVAVSGLAPAAPTKLVITNVSPASPLQNGSFNVTVTAEDGSNGVQVVQGNTAISLSSNGTGTLGGTPSGTINAGSSSVVITTSDNVAENIILTASRTSGDNLTSGTSSTITIQAVASHIAFAGLSLSGVANTNIATFSVSALKPDGSVDVNYTSNVIISKASGSG